MKKIKTQAFWPDLEHVPEHLKTAIIQKLQLTRFGGEAETETLFETLWKKSPLVKLMYLLLAISAVTSAIFWYNSMDDIASKVIFAAVAFILVILLPTFVEMVMWSGPLIGMFVVKGLGAVMIGFTVVTSVIATGGLTSNNLEITEKKRERSTGSYASLKKAAKDKQAALLTATELTSRSPEVIASNINYSQIIVRRKSASKIAIWNRTDQCRDVTIKESARACAQILELRTELKAAQSIPKLRFAAERAQKAFENADTVADKSALVGIVTKWTSLTDSEFKDGFPLVRAGAIEILFDFLPLALKLMLMATALKMVFKTNQSLARDIMDEALEEEAQRIEAAKQAEQAAKNIPANMPQLMEEKDYLGVVVKKQEDELAQLKAANDRLKRSNMPHILDADSPEGKVAIYVQKRLVPVSGQYLEMSKVWDDYKIYTKRQHGCDVVAFRSFLLKAGCQLDVVGGEEVVLHTALAQLRAVS